MRPLRIAGSRGGPLHTHADRNHGAMPVPRDLSEDTIAHLVRRIDAATAALPSSPDTALRELRQARSLLLASSTDASPTAQPDPRLTPREREVLGLLSIGSRNKEIALRLGLRERTVKFHVANVLRKLDAQSRTEALRRALEMGLLESGGLSLAK
jgi:two-component system, NarL family, nitrate/nitrite response regulator NarL